MTINILLRRLLINFEALFMRVLTKIILISFLFFSEGSFADPPSLIYVSTEFDNQTDLSVPYLSFRSDDGIISSTLNIEQKGPAVGRFIVGLLPNTSGIATLSNFSGGNSNQLCQFKFSVVSSSYATISEISQNTNGPYLCSFSGNPNDNSAKIIVKKQV